MFVKLAQALNASLKVNTNTIPLLWEAKAQMCWGLHLHPWQTPRQQIKASAYAQDHYLLPKLNTNNKQIPASDIKINLKLRLCLDGD